MPKVLLVAEKPDAGREIAAALTGKKFTGKGPHHGVTKDGIEVTVATASGHIYELAKPEHYDPKFGAWNPTDLPIVPPKLWEFTELPRENAGSYINILKKEAVAHAGAEIVNVCDSEREGEVIFRKALKGVGAPGKTTYSRMWLQTMTAEGILESFASRKPLANYNGLAQAGFTRDQADWLVGMNLTVLSTKTLPRGKGDWKLWSVGRVQTPTLALIVERDLLIEHFVPQEFWEAYGAFDGLEAKAELDAYAESPDRVKLLGAPKVTAERDKKVFWSRDKGEAFGASAMAPAAYKATDKKSTKTEKPPLPFDLQEMQKLFSKKFGLTANETLEIMQKLYEAKLLSYPRTDCRFLPEDMKEGLYGHLVRIMAHLRKILPAMHLCKQELMDKKTAAASRAFNSKNVTGHYALVPTGELAGLESLGKHELFAYLAVLQCTLKALDEPATFNVITRRYTQEGGAAPYVPAIFKASREELSYPGFMRWEKREQKDTVPLPPITEKQALRGVTLKELNTKPPEHYSDATILDAMKFAGRNIDDDMPEEKLEEMMGVLKDKGIGTSATRANIIEKLVDRGFVAREKSRLISTGNGRLLCRELAPRAPNLLSASLTGEWELILKKMERGEAQMNRSEFLDALLKDVVAMKEAFLKSSTRPIAPPQAAVTEGTPVEGAICPKSKKPLLDRGPFFESAGFPGVRLWKIAFGRDFAAAEYITLIEGVLAKKPYLATGLKSAQGGRVYEAPLTIDEEKKKLVIFTPEPTKVKGVKCPASGKLIADFGKYFEAPGFPGVRLWKTAFGREFTAMDYVPILQGWVDKKPVTVDKLVSGKTGNVYSAQLVLDPETNRVKLAFEERAA